MSANGKFRMGLNVRKSVETAVGPKKTANIFGDESDDDEQQNAAEKFERKYAASAGTKAREQRIVEKELAKNPDIFDYDTHYEEIQQQRDQKVATQKEADKEKKPKYAHLLAKAHKQRELSKLLVEENTYKKEREKEAGQFEDEEVFVTGAYRQQIEEREQHKTEMEREEALEKMRDVRDQKMWQQAFNRTMLENISRGPLTEEGKMEEDDGAEEKRIKTEAKTEKMTKMEVKEEAMEEEKGRTEEEERHGEEGRDERKRKEGEKEKKTDGKRQRRQPTPPAEEGGKGGEEVQQRPEEKRHRRRRERTDEKEERETGRTTDDGRKRARKGDESEGSREKAEQKQDEEAQRMARIRQVLAKRNDENAIEEARQRYLERRRGGLIVAPRIQAAE
ncbi:hypothetical protein niasHT_039797 [Heterodera trifolii]|uniref:Nuclear speckle splicing regulatory protein 1 N-terminal domain-containing protein n=1 Tax=Heterodera trifolii TaxID=157864 RepID=A0ABD2IU29_9BILA